MRPDTRSAAQVILPLLIISTLVSVAFITAIILFATSHALVGVITLGVASLGFVILFCKLKNEINRETAKSAASDLPSPALSY